MDARYHIVWIIFTYIVLSEPSVSLAVEQGLLDESIVVVRAVPWKLRGFTWKNTVPLWHCVGA